MLLVGVMFWGLTFSVIKEAMNFIDVFSFISIRFLLASLLLSIIFYKSLKKITKKVIIKGVIIGSVLSTSFLLQTTGIKYTTASNAGFITGLGVILVPIFVSIIDRKWPKFIEVLAVLIATIGLALLTINSKTLTINIGDLLSLLSAVSFGMHLILISRFAKDINPPVFTIIQLATVGLENGLFGFLVNKNITFPNQFIVWKAILFCTVFASAYMYTTQAYLQRYITEIKAALIFTSEPLFAAIFAYLLLGERLLAKGVVGGILIIIALLLSELKKILTSKFTFAKNNN